MRRRTAWRANEASDSNRVKTRCLPDAYLSKREDCGRGPVGIAPTGAAFRRLTASYTASFAASLSLSRSAGSRLLCTGSGTDCCHGGTSRPSPSIAMRVGALCRGGHWPARPFLLAVAGGVALLPRKAACTARQIARPMFGSSSRYRLDAKGYRLGANRRHGRAASLSGPAGLPTPQHRAAAGYSATSHDVAPRNAPVTPALPMRVAAHPGLSGLRGRRPSFLPGPAVVAP